MQGQDRPSLEHHMCIAQSHVLWVTEQHTQQFQCQLICMQEHQASIEVWYDTSHMHSMGHWIQVDESHQHSNQGGR
jgi:hypothetical protein